MSKEKLKIGEEGHLNDLAVGQAAKVIAIHNDDKILRRRLLDMGLTKGTIVSIKKIAPLGDPVDIYIRGYELCLRRKELESIDIMVVIMK